MTWEVRDRKMSAGERIMGELVVGSRESMAFVVIVGMAGFGGLEEVEGWFWFLEEEVAI